MVNLQAPVPIRAGVAHEPSVLPVIIPPNTIRPLAFRTLSRRHNLAFTSSTLQTLASFIGKCCGSRWRQEGLADLVIDEVARIWKQSGGGSIVEDGPKLSLRTILADLETYMVGGRVQKDRKTAPKQGPDTPYSIPQNTRRSDSTAQLPEEGLSAPPAGKEPVESSDPSHDRARKRARVVSAFEQQRLTYNPNKKHFEVAHGRPSLLPPASHRVSLFRDRYYRLHQRLLRNEAFQTSTLPTSFSESGTSSQANQPLKLSSISSLQGRGGTNHLLMGLLSISPTGGHSLSDPTGTVAVDLQHAKGIPVNGAWFVPGMILLVEGVYQDEDEDTAVISAGSIGGKFFVLSMGGPPCERREVSLGIDNQSRGWSTKLPTDSSLDPSDQSESTKKNSLSQRMVIMGEVNLDNPKTLQALTVVLGKYDAAADDIPNLSFVLIGNFVHDAAIGAGNCGSIEYKEFFDSLASVLSEFPNLLRSSTFVFVPGENDPWASSFSPGATGCIPRPLIPELFTSRVRRSFQSAYSHDHSVSSRQIDESAVWSSNPTRITIDEPSLSEIIVFRDDISARLRRSAVVLRNDNPSKPSAEDATESSTQDTTGLEIEEEDAPAQDEEQVIDPSLLAARKLVKSILDQGYLSPFSPTVRPVLWDYASALHLYPLPTALVLADPDADPFTVTYEGCHVMNPGRFVVEGGTDTARWIEYNVSTKKGCIKEEYI